MPAGEALDEVLHHCKANMQPDTRSKTENILLRQRPDADLAKRETYKFTEITHSLLAPRAVDSRLDIAAPVRNCRARASLQ